MGNRARLPNLMGFKLASAGHAVDDDLLEVNCGRCGRPLLMQISDVRDKPTVECPDCQRTAAATDAAQSDVAGDSDGAQADLSLLQRPPAHRRDPC